MCRIQKQSKEGSLDEIGWRISNKPKKARGKMSKKPRPMVPVTAKIDPELAKPFYKVVNEEFGGNVSEAVREGIKALIIQRTVAHEKFSPELTKTFYKLVDDEFGGDVCKTVRAAVKLLIADRYPHII